MAKKLLEEQDVRKFMKIAGIHRLSENFISSIEEEKDEMGDEVSPPEEGDEMEVDVSEPEDAEGGVEMEPEMDMEEPAGGMKSHEEKVKLIQDLARELFNDPELEIEIESEDQGDEMSDAGEMEDEVEMDAGDADETMEDEVMSEESQLEEGEELDEGNVKSGSVPKPTKIKGQDQKMKPASHSSKNSVGSKKMEESRDALKNQIVEQVAKRVAQRLRDLK